MELQAHNTGCECKFRKLLNNRGDTPPLWQEYSEKVATVRTDGKSLAILQTSDIQIRFQNTSKLEFSARLDAVMKHAEVAFAAPAGAITTKKQPAKGKGKNLTNSATLSFASDTLARAFFFKYNELPWQTADGARTVLVNLRNAKFEQEARSRTLDAIGAS